MSAPKLLRPRLRLMPKLLMIVVPAGVALGAALGQMAHPVMKFAEGADWRARFESAFPASPLQFVDSGPEDLSPYAAYPLAAGPSYLPPLVDEARYLPPLEEATPDLMPASLQTAADEPAPALEHEVDRASLEAADTAAELAAPSPPPPRPQAPEAAKRDEGAASPAADQALRRDLGNGFSNL